MSPDDEVARLAQHGIVRVRAANPGPFTLSGTNTWIVGRDPVWVIDPGPALEPHLEAIAAAVAARGGLGGVALTHGHADHAEAVSAVIDRCGGGGGSSSAGGGRVAAGVSGHAAALGGELGDRAARFADVELADGDRFGPLTAVATPGHAPDHLAFLAGGACFSGDAVLGEGSVFIAPDPGAMGGYLDALRRLRALPIEVICPGHGPPVWEPRAKLDEYLAHRLERERRLLDALGAGRRGVEELLDDVWSDVPVQLRPAATMTLAAHLDKLAEEGRLPDGVQRPRLQ